MPISYLFWFLMLLWLVFYLWSYWPGRPALAYAPYGHGLLLFVLMALLGWHVFGAAVR